MTVASVTEPGKKAPGAAVGIPPEALPQWIELAGAIAVSGRVPCETNPELWWEKDTAADAVAACAPCGVRVECLAYAMAAKEREGVWGGLAPHARRDCSVPA